MGLIIVLLVIGVLSVIGAIKAWQRVRRTQDIAAIATRAGVHYSEGDPFDCTRVSFGLFQRGDGRGAENVLWYEPPDGHVYRAFDYWYYDETKDQYGRSNRTYHRFSCATALVGSSWPGITIEREGLVAKVTNALSGGDIDFESEEFNRLFSVHCDDRRFASALLDANLLDFIMSTKGELNYELKGRWLLVWTAPPVSATLVPAMMRVAEEFVKRIPAVVWDLYPSDFVDKAGRPLPPGDDPESRMKDEVAIAALHDDDDGQFEALDHSPFEALERHDGVDFDLDGHPLPKVEEDPWGHGRS